MIQHQQQNLTNAQNPVQSQGNQQASINGGQNQLQSHLMQAKQAAGQLKLPPGYLLQQTGSNGTQQS